MYAIDRNPIPDYYTITLEISRDRTTLARQVKCTGRRNSCPASVDVGDAFLRRDINAACHKKVRPFTTATSVFRSILTAVLACSKPFYQ